MTIEAENVAIVEQFWEALKRRDFEAVGAFMAPAGHYIDVPVIDSEPGAFGPDETVARLRLGLEPLEAYELMNGNIVASDNMVVTEHSERWTWHTGETTLLRFVSVMELQEGFVTRWWDYFNLPALMNAAPEWWVARIMQGYK